MDETPTLPFNAAAERNKVPILKALRELLPEHARVLEVASGTGQHAAYFASEQPLWQWQPSDSDTSLLLGIKQRCAGLANVAPPLRLDVLARSIPALPGARFDAMYCANLLHIAPWTATAAVMRLAARQVARGGLLLVYGPFEIEGEALAPSNAAFDADLRARDARWGLRRLGEVRRVAEEAGLEFDRRVAMPANNLMLVWRRPGPKAG
jgi:SAM-dependent methyltransferase